MQAKYDRAQMVRLICEGLSSYQIAARLHVTASTVRKAARQLKQQQAGTYTPRGRSFYSERLIDLVPKTTKIDDAKRATLKANRRELIKEAVAARRKPLVALADLPVVDLPAIHCSEHLAVAEFGSGRVLQTIMDDPSWPGIQILRLSELKTPHLHSSQIGGRWISLRFRNRESVQSLINHLQQVMKGFDP